MATADPILTILFVDISESSKLYRLLGDQKASRVVADFLIDLLKSLMHTKAALLTVLGRVDDTF